MLSLVRVLSYFFLCCRILFELLVLAGFQVELSWTTILHNREAYRYCALDIGYDSDFLIMHNLLTFFYCRGNREVFTGFDPSAIARFKEKHIQSLEADRSLGLPAGKVRGVVENARRVLEVCIFYL